MQDLQLNVFPPIAVGKGLIAYCPRNQQLPLSNLDSINSDVMYDNVCKLFVGL